VLAQVFQAIGGGLHNHNSDFATCQVLLVLEICIHRDQDIKSSFRRGSEAHRFLFQTSPLPEPSGIRDPD
jgi:hypothetical protein